MILKGEKVVLRPLEVEDARTIVPLINDAELRQYLLQVFPINKFMEENWIKNHSSSSNEVNLAITTDDELIGVTGYMNIDWVNRCAEFGIGIFNKKYWGKGYGTETTKLMLEYAFRKLNLNRVYLRVFDYNERAIRAYEKCGFVLEGRQRQAVFSNGRYHDVLMMSILAEEYFKP
ncbi:GNAT family N-acetyltransferase [Kosmotoga olearia]|uniref:GCN5-related N-acetyltransferase n=1 Tax=Kosmotoga olearia (strain ATCC BAA-1733 / DSM 21960 / TBF 19.5.1) TaxID=521045 RepID=C5CIM4_KOSOT|nr:GNAT family protein [Kosmotoga olearia]ACR79886.1 GCN5-related N-acetyltransferase [Kosmotoga olearia TBF 19.5.1]